MMNRLKTAQEQLVALRLDLATDPFNSAALGNIFFALQHLQMAEWQLRHIHGKEWTKEKERAAK